jgi:hypothetical protein
MAGCKKFKPAEAVSFVTKPAGDCAGCVYFSASNCGQHVALTQNSDGNLFSSTD